MQRKRRKKGKIINDESCIDCDYCHMVRGLLFQIPICELEDDKCGIIKGNMAIMGVPRWCPKRRGYS